MNPCALKRWWYSQIKEGNRNEKEKSSRDESLLGNSLWSSCDEEISEAGFKQQMINFIGFLWFYTHGSFSMVNSKYQQTQVIVRLIYKSDSFLMRNMHNLLLSTVQLFKAIGSLMNRIGTVGLHWLAGMPNNSWKSSLPWIDVRLFTEVVALDVKWLVFFSLPKSYWWAVRLQKLVYDGDLYNT